MSALAAFCVAGWTGWHALQIRSDRVFEEGFTFERDEIPGDPEGFGMRGWAGVVRSGARPALSLSPGGRGLIAYRFPYAPGERAVVRLCVRNDRVISTRAVLQTSGKRLHSLIAPEAGADSPFVDWEMDLTRFLVTGHDFHLTIDCRREAEPLAPRALPAILSARFELRSPAWRPVKPFRAAFFLALMFLLWWFLIGFVVPAAGGGVLVMLRAHRTVPSGRARALQALAPVAFLVLIVLIGAHPSWRARKKHDDMWALGNTRLLALSRFDTESLFFRSRIRPAFPALAMPFMVGLEYRTATVTRTPSDFYSRLFHVYDRAGAWWRKRVYPEVSLFAFCLAALALGMLPALWMAVDRGRGAPGRAAWGAVFGALFWLRALDTAQFNVITLSATWAFQVAAMLAFLRALRRPDVWGNWVVAGGAIGLSILFKESSIALLFPIGVFGVWRLIARRADVGGKGWGGAVVGALVCAVFPLVYFGWALPDGVVEVWRQWAGHRASVSILEGYFLPTPGGIANGVYAMFGFWGIVVVVAGVWRVARTPRAPVLHLCVLWLLGSASVFALPYFFARFLIYGIPAAGWLLGAVVGDAVRWGARLSRQSGE